MSLNLCRKNELEKIIYKLQKLVSDYSPNKKIIDHTFVKRIKISKSDFILLKMKFKLCLILQI